VLRCDEPDVADQQRCDSRKEGGSAIMRVNDIDTPGSTEPAQLQHRLPIECTLLGYWDDLQICSFRTCRKSPGHWTSDQNLNTLLAQPQA